MPTQEDFQHRAIEILHEVFPGSLETVAEGLGPDEQSADIVFQTGEELLVIVAKRMDSTRLRDLEGRLAVATLEVSRRARDMNAPPVIMIALPKLGPKASAFAARFMFQYAPDLGWCLYDPNGAYKFEIAALNVSEERLPGPERRSRALPAREALFSDLNRLMLKILLLREVSAEFWGGPRQVVRTAKDLKTVAKVSTEKAYSFLRTFTAAGYVRETKAGIDVVRRDELMRTWLNHELAFCTESVPVRSIYGPPSDLAPILLRPEGPTEFAVTGFEACRRLGVLHTPVPRREVCLHGDIDLAISAWELRKCESRDADFFLVKTANPKSVLRGALSKNGLPVVDLLEAAIAVYGQVPRGAEQAGFIFTEVLHWDGCV